jgi:hypothetical protein
MNNTTRSDVKQLAQQIETLAKEVQTKLESGGDFLPVANELVRNNLTFVFTLGEIFALEQSGAAKKKIRATMVSNPSGLPRNYHNMRDSLGRFKSKI